MIRFKLGMAGALLLVFVASGVGHAQVGTGLPAFGSFSSGGPDTINYGNLNIHLQIPILNKGGRGLPFYYILTYDSTIWSPENASGQSVWTPSGSWGWGGITSANTGYVTFTSQPESCEYDNGQQQYNWTVYLFGSYVDPNGTAHTIGADVSTWASGAPCGGGPPSSATVTAIDGSGYTFTVTTGPSATIYSASGETIAPLQANLGTSGSITDSNGNRLSASTSNGTTTYTDTLGDTALTVSGSALTYTGPSGQPESFTINYTTYTVQTDFRCSGITEYGPQYPSLVSSIDLPDGTSYSFTYDGFGRMTAVTLPTGGTISYEYTGGSNNTGIECADGSTAGLTRTLSGTGIPTGSTWTYTRSGTIPTASVTTVVDPALNQMVIDFSGDYTGDYYETERQLQQGSGTILETIYTCYGFNGQNGGSAPSPPCNGETLNDNFISQVAVTVQLNDTSQEARTVTDYNSYGLPTEVDEYGYGNGSPSSIYQKTYLYYCPNSTYCSASTTPPDRVYQSQIELGGTTLAAQANYTYDANGNLLTETHANTNFTPASISRSFTYNSNGTLATAKDFNGNETTYTYTGTDNCNQSFPTTIQSPVSAVKTTLEWNCNNGQEAQTTDPNSQTTKYTYDLMNRLCEVDAPNGGQTIWTYSATERERSILLSGSPGTTCVAASGSTYRTDTTLLDALGRVQYSELTSDPAGTDIVETYYDSLGRVSTATYPYRTTSTGYDTYSYDALSRLVSITHADGDKITYMYGSAVSGASGNGSQRCWTSGSGYETLVADEQGTLSEMWQDSRGRVIEADEADPANGNMTDSGALSTCYLYNAIANELTTVDQGSQSRGYNYDMLGRMTSETNPESGTTDYGYDANGNVTTRTDARSIITTYAYDALNRLTSKSYSDGTTPTAQFWYDGSGSGIDNWVLTGLTNTVGRMSTACNGPCNAASTATIYSYDPMGRVTTFWQCTTYNCGSSSSLWKTSYNYDLAGDVTSWTHPEGFTITNSINGAQQITQIQSSLGAPYPTQLASSISYEPWGALSNITDGCYGTGQNQGCTQATEGYAYNNRLQVINLGNADFCMAYNYYASVGTGTTCNAPASGHGNNGSVLGFVSGHVNGSLNHSETFTYDSLHRLTSAVATKLNSGNVSYNLSFSYDRYGNMTCVENSSTNGPCPQLGYGTTITNRISTYAGSSVSYDADGNLTNDGVYTYTYDAEGRVTSVTGGGVDNTYGYDALGQRATWNWNGAQYLHDPSGGLLGVFSTATDSWYFETVTFAGQRRFDYLNGNLYAYHPDILGTVRQVTLQDGSVYGDNLLYPWGQLWTDSGSPTNLFAGFQGWDGNVGAGMYSAQLRAYPVNYGRWLTPDPAGLTAMDVRNPQSLNRYAYVTNRPTTLTDRAGLHSCTDPTTAEGDAECGSSGGQGWLGTGGAGGGGGGGGGLSGTNWGAWAPPPSLLSGAQLAGEALAEAAYMASNCIGCVEFQGITFSSMDAYFDWSTSLAAQTQNVAYGLFSTFAAAQGLDPNRTYTVNTWYQASELNIQVVGDTVMEVPVSYTLDPLTFTHNGDSSYFDLSNLFDADHYVFDAGGVEYHQDLFGALNPLHYLDWAVGYITGPGPITAFTCQVNVGCH